MKPRFLIICAMVAILTVFSAIPVLAYDTAPGSTGEASDGGMPCVRDESMNNLPCSTTPQGGDTGSEVLPREGKVLDIGETAGSSSLGQGDSVPSALNQSGDSEEAPVSSEGLKADELPADDTATRLASLDDSASPVSDHVTTHVSPAPIVGSASDGAVPTGSSSVVFSETFEGDFPGDNWHVGDWNSTADADYWDDTSYRAGAGSWSAWCAQIGNNSASGGGTNVSYHKYDNNMDAYMLKKYVVDMSSWDVGYVDFYSWANTESAYDYLDAEWYNGSAWAEDSSKKITGTSSWTRNYWQVPYSYMHANGATGFKFHSDGSVVNEGVYIDNVQLVSVDVTVGSSSYLSSGTIGAGETIIMYFYIHNPAPFSVQCGLGASLYNGTYYEDPAHDIVVTIPSGYSWQQRYFDTSAASTPVGTYDVIFGLWSTTPGDTSNGNRAWGIYNKTGSLVIEPSESPADLLWTDIWTNPDPPTGGQSATVYAQLKNQGGTTSLVSRNTISVDGTTVDSWDQAGLGSSSTVDRSFNTTRGPGYHTIQASADVNGNVPESNEGNNAYQESLWWKGPDLVVEDIWWVDSYGTNTGTVTSGQPFTVYLTIRNSGDAIAASAFRTKLYIDGAYYGYGDFTGLNSGNTVTWYWEDVSLSSSGSHTFRGFVDADYQISEANTATGSGVGTAENNNERSESLSIANAKWTVLAYMDGDNNLEGYVIDDFEDMANPGCSSSTSHSVVAQMDRISGFDSSYGDWTDCQRFFITQDLDPTTANSLQGMGEVDMGAQSTLESFLTWGVGRFAADHYLVIIEDHGGSWVGCCWDDTSGGGSHLNLSEIKNSLSATESAIGRNIDIVLFDDCLMGSVEVASEVYPHVDYAVVSETIGWTSSFPYDSSSGTGIIEYLKSNPTVTPSAYAVEIVNLAYAVDHATYVTQSIAAYDLSRMSGFVSSANSLATNLKTYMADYRSSMVTARANSSDMEGPYGGQYERIIDLYQYASNIKANVAQSSVQNAAQDVMNRIGPSGGAAGYLVMKEKHTSATSFCHGMSIYYPIDRASYDSAYGSSGTFVSSTQWDEFLQSVYDTSLPNTSITDGPSGTIDYNDVTFVWTGTDDTTPVGSLLYSYTLVGYDSGWSSWGSGTSRSYNDLANGSYTFRVKARDVAGNEDSTPAERAFTVNVDVSAPNTSITDGPSGTIDHNDVSFAWTGTDDTTPVESLVYSYTLVGYDSGWSSWGSGTSRSYSDLANGSYTFRVKARDLGGNEDSTPAERAFTVNVALYGVTWNSHNTPTTMDANQTYAVSVNLTNTGSYTWPSGGANPVYLSYHWYTSGASLVAWDGQRSALAADVAPGGSTTVSATVTAPGEAGSYVLRWDMVQEGVTWFSLAGCSTRDVGVGIATEYGVTWNSDNTPTAMDAGQAYAVSVNLTNGGNFTWPSGGANPVHLAYHWYTSDGYLIQWDGERSVLSTDVAPGGSTTVSATVTAPGEAGSYILKWDLVQEGVTWFSLAGCSTRDVSVGIAAEYGVTWNSDSTPTTMNAGQAYAVSVNLTNDSNFTWPSGGANPVHLAYHWYTSDGYLVQWDGQRSVLSTDVAPGGSTTVSATVTAPGEAGSYILKWDLVQEGVTWFSLAGCSTRDVGVNIAAQYGATWNGHDTPTAMEAGQTYVVSITITNTSNFTWPSGGANPVHLAYHWYTSDGQLVQWDGQRSVLSTDLAPGESTTVSATVTAPGAAGSYILKWDPVQEGVTWFGLAGCSTLDVGVAVS